MKLVDYNVIEVVGLKVAQMINSAHRLNRRKYDVRISVLLSTGISTERCVRPDASISIERLGKDLIAVGDKEHALEQMRLTTIERTQPSLAYSRSEYN